MSTRIWSRFDTAGFAVASILAGSTALAASISVSRQPSLAQHATVVDSTMPVQVAPTVLPELRGHAVFNRISTPWHFVLRAPDLSPPVVVQQSQASCRPFWHRLETGPVGEVVLVTCPGAQDNVPPEPPHKIDPSHLQLPTISDFVEPVVQLPLLAIGDHARQSGQVVADSLERGIQRFNERVAPPALPPTPDFGALGWTPSAVSAG